MFRLLRQLKNGVDYDKLVDREKDLFNKLTEIGVVFNSHYKGKNVYKLSNTAKMNYRDNHATFEIFPNRAIGVFFEYDDVFECVSENKEKPKAYFMAYALNPEKNIVENFDIGNNVRVKVIARGYNYSNEGLLVRLPNRENDFFGLDTPPCITIGLSPNAKSKDTGKLSFDEEIKNGKFIEGRKGIIINGKVYFNIKEIKENSVLYDLNFENNEYKLKKLEDKKLYNR